MHCRTLVLRSLRHRWRSHLGVLLGAAIGSAALIGALVVGDSVRGSLRAQALQRLGWVEIAIAPADRFFTADLGRPASSNAPHAGLGAISPFARLTTALRLPATAARQDGAARANQTQVLGVQSNFWPANLTADFAAMPPGSVWLNEPLAAQLNAKPGDGVVLRIHKPSALSRDVPITPQADASVALRLTVQRVLTGAELGNFSLLSGQALPLNAFVRLDELDLPAGLKGKANLLLAARVEAKARDAAPQADRNWLQAGTRLADYGLHVRAVTNLAAPAPGAASVEVWTDRIFLDPVVTKSALLLAVPNNSNAPVATAAAEVLTYLVNQLRAGERLVPYSMVTAAGPPWTPSDLGADEIVVNQWLAEQLQLKAGDAVELAYFLPESGGSLLERTNRFRVHSIVPLAGVHADRTLMPEFPGLAKAESTHDWDAGFPLVHKIREEDEAYWKQNRGTPKAFVSLAAGQRMWTNRFGDATSVRLAVSAAEAGDGDGVGKVERALHERLAPAEFGLTFEPVRERALAASAQAQDFGELFLSFSFFLIVAALILMALLFQFGLEQRTAEVGTLLAIGFPPARVRSVFLIEGVVIALAGGIAGVLGGLVYARAMLEGLSTIWRDAIGASALEFYVTSLTLGIGLLASVAVCALTIWITLRKLGRRPARELLAEGAELGDAGAGGGEGRSGLFARTVALVATLGGGGLIGWAMAGEERNTPPVFFGAGALLLVAGLAAVSWLLRRWERVEAGRALTFLSLGWRGATRRRTRSLASIALLASGSFLIVAVGANRLDADKDAARRSWGTGGFALIGESTLPIVRDLNTGAGREFYGLEEGAMTGVQVVPFRVRDGDEASCLNLNRAQRPRLLGVKPELLAERSAFTFAALASRSGSDGPWLSLKTDPSSEPDAIPAVGDAASIQWALKKKLGDTLDYTDERGREFKVRLVGAVANSVLQGSLVIDEAHFKRRFPGESGHRMFLIDVPSNHPPTKVAAALSRALQDTGFQTTPTARRLADFNAVQNTYLNTFQVLGGLGLLLGSAGLGVVVLRNVLERRAELGVMQAVGFRRRRLQWLVLSEHGGLLLAGIAVGLTSALVAVLPVLLAPGAELHTRALSVTLGGVLLTGGICTVVATQWALRGRLLDAIRSE